MTAFLQIDQEGLPAGTPGRSRTDGLAGGAPVTLTDTGPGGSTEFRLLWTPPGDVDAVASLAATGDPKVWTFTPTAGKYGSYLVVLVRNAGLTSETRERRVIVMRTPNLGLVIPALGERGYPTASLEDSAGAELVDNNATDFADAALNALPYAAWWRTMHELIVRVDALSGGGSAGPAPTVTLAYHVSASTSTDDPGGEHVALNQGPPGGSQPFSDVLTINPGDMSGLDWSAFFNDLKTGFVRVESLDGAAWILFQITDVVTVDSYYRLAITLVQSTSETNPFGEEAEVRLVFDAAKTGRGSALPSISGESTAALLDAVIAALVTQGLVTDDR